MAVSTRLFEEKDFSQINHLLQLYYELGYPTTSERLIARLSKITNNKVIICCCCLKMKKS